MRLIPTILCGGAGSRLWPVSREMDPKPFIRLGDGENLLQKAFLRAARLPDVQELMTVTNQDLFFKTRDAYSEVNSGSLDTTFILEPVGRNTAPAIALALLQLEKLHGDDVLMLVLPADHVIADEVAFAHAVEAATALAAQGKIVTFGIEPNAPETGYGYIEVEGSRVIRFVEKPSLEKAQEYLASGNYFWNAGMFCFAVSAMRREMERHCPELLETATACLKQGRVINGDGLSSLELERKSFAQMPDISIDYAVMEKCSGMVVVPCNIGWNDIGSWSALSELVMADAQGNRVEGEALLHDTSNCYIRGNQRMVGVVGLHNLIIIDTPDALLVADREHAQDVKHIYAKLKSDGHATYRLHRTVHRPWGTYTVLEEGSRFKIKRIVVKPGASLSLQLHHHRSEHWIVVSGMARVVNGDREMFVNTNESTYIPAGYRHRLENPGILHLVMIEVQSGEYLGEDDIKRFDDHYGRA